MGVGSWWGSGPGRGCCHPCPGARSQAGMLESHCHHLLLGPRDTGHCHSPAGMCLLPLSGILVLGTTGAWHRVAPGPPDFGILALSTTRIWYHRASHCSRSQYAGEMELRWLCTSSRMEAEPGPVSQRQNSLQEPPPFLLKMPDPCLCSSTPP